uniref:ParB-like N-terminal domain-containing protein n=1 Tax=viral metagenome TaxID=1070528 RepID=A0A6H1ZUW5_9ZZZZ
MDSVFKEISLDLIDTEGQSIREATDDDHVIELSMNILAHGLLQPIVLRPKDGGRYQLDAGFHRLAAFYRLGKKKIPSHIRSGDDGSTKAIALVENIIRRDISVKEQCEAVKHLNEDEKLSPSQICDLLGKTRQWVDVRLAIPNFPEDIKNEVMEGHVSIRTGEIIATIEDMPTRNFLINQAINCHYTARQISELVELYKQTPSINEAVEAGLAKKEEIEKAPSIYRRCQRCGKAQRLEMLTFVPICMYGCEPEENERELSKKKEETTDAA